MTVTETNGTPKAPDPARQPEEVAKTLAQAALQATARALHTAQLALDATKRMGVGSAEIATAMERLRNDLADAYADMPVHVRLSILAAPGTIGGDELLDLLATLVAARNGKHGGNNVTTEEQSA